MTTPLLHGFPPVVDGAARVLILGSFPSVRSLEARQYYGNPRNAFWPITSALFDFDVRAPYETRLAALQSGGVALWDVLHNCRRVGSSDAKIDQKTLVVNDFERLFASYRCIRRVYFNGRTAETLFRRFVHVDARVSYCVLPSTSPAHAISQGQKLDAWRVITSS
ncbi:MAG: DNA-deoxyinosine glycosylase [Mycobacterium sp.]|nr:DNA-deoxyinosine glycosylase [Mycobacterium sp.]MBV9722014.1 DNA-deoxyinosine glycosylase [Mycobacterium sp.]